MSALLLDSSAVLALLLREPDADRFLEAMLRHPVRWVSAVTLTELSIALGRRHGPGAQSVVNAFLSAYAVQVASFDASQADEARIAFERFGKGRHPAALNFGDCCAYAASRCLNLPLLQKGDDFPRTDVRRVEV